jgi:hypothetical protein
MRIHLSARRLASTFLMTALVVGLLPSVGLAQTTSTSSSGPRLLRVLTPNNGVGASQNLTATGVAVDCASGQAATRVAIYDGTSVANGTYLADVSMDTTKNLATYCQGKSGTGKFGWTVIFSTASLQDGAHTLTFAAEYPGGGTQTTSLEISVANRLEFDQQCPARDTCNIDPNTGGRFVPAGVIVGDQNAPVGPYGRPLGTTPAQMVCDPFGGTCNNGLNGYNGQPSLYGPGGSCASIDATGRCVPAQGSNVNQGTSPAPTNGQFTSCTQFDAQGQCISNQASNGASPLPVPCPSAPTTYCIFDGSTYVPIQ